MTEYKGTTDLKLLLPHRDPMVLIDRVVSISEEDIICEVNITDESFLSEQGQVPSYVGMEYIAQTIAAFGGISKIGAKNELNIGFLLGVKNYIPEREFFHSGEKLTVQATVNFFEGSLGSFDGSIFIDGERIVKSKVSIFKPTDVDLANLKESVNA